MHNIGKDAIFAWNCIYSQSEQESIKNRWLFVWEYNGVNDHKKIYFFSLIHRDADFIERGKSQTSWATPSQSGVNPDYRIKTSGLTRDGYETFKLGVTPT